MAAFAEQYEAYRRAVEEFLSAQFTDKPRWMDLYEAMRYSLLSGGKRIRPVLTLEFARLAGGEEALLDGKRRDWRTALPAACALEMVHTYSLIHDDLPCMDDDDLRRGRPSNHKVYGETLAVLAGDALQAEAFRLILTAPDLSPVQRADCALILARAAGADGMVAGQVLDTLHQPETEAELTRVHRLKTGAMIAGSCQLGVASVSGASELLTAAGEYGYELGLAFQIQDDVLDVTADEAEFGKPVGSDQESGKVTFVDLFGVKTCGRLVREHTDQAISAVSAFDRDGFLRQLAQSLVERKK